MIIRETTEADLSVILAVQESAFGQREEAELTAALLSDPTAAPLISLLAFMEEQAVGHILFTRVRISGEDRVSASILAPLAVVPGVQGQGVGGVLIRKGLKFLADRHTDLVFVLGHPDYYPRFGFQPAGGEGLQAPYPIPPEHADAWMVQALREDMLGSVTGRIICSETLGREEYWRE